jgi:peptidoglycan/LPS O-acetylase OafA/YrhL
MNAGINVVRFLLAFNVVIFHIWNDVAPGAGPVAVLAFFYISGYLITQISQEVYAAPGQTGAFFLNRFLRIYPQYICAVMLGLIAIHYFPDSAYDIHTNLSWPSGAAEWVPQFAIFGLYDSDVRVVPAAWSLSTELYYYLLIGLLTGRSKKLATALFVVSVPVGALCALKILPFDFYGHPIGNGFAFAFGGVTYFYRNALTVGRTLFAVACAAYGVHSYALPLLFEDGLDDANLAGSLVCFCPLFIYLVQNNISEGRIAARANVLGKMAYPLFLTHWAACVFVSNLLFGGHPNRDSPNLPAAGAYFFCVLLGALAFSGLFYQLIDQPVERIRKNIRLRAKSKARPEKQADTPA